jgi:hypothetical protein
MFAAAPVDVAVLAGATFTAAAARVTSPACDPRFPSSFSNRGCEPAGEVKTSDASDKRFFRISVTPRGFRLTLNVSDTCEEDRDSSCLVLTSRPGSDCGCPLAAAVAEMIDARTAGTICDAAGDDEIV